MKISREIKLNNGKVEIVTKQEHKFSNIEKEILKTLALNGYYEIRGFFQEHPKEFNAIHNLKKLGLVKEDYDAWHYTVDVIKSEEVGSFFLQILKEGI